jgi:cyclophilin family peptidyl-prolyl cis-trans isomerase
MMYNNLSKNDANGEEIPLPLHCSSEKMPLHVNPPDNSEQSSSEHVWCCNAEEGRVSPAYSANPQCPADDTCFMNGGISKGGRKSKSFSSSSRIPFFFIGFILVGMGAIYTSRETVNSAAEQVLILDRNRQLMDDQVKKAEKELIVLKREISAIDLMIEKEQSLDVANKNMRVSNYRALHEMNTLQNRLKEEVKQADSLKHKVQVASLEEVNQKYGSGVHHVEIELIFPDKKEGPTKFVIELAPTELVPHAVQTFLEMVSTGLLDGCSFILNALHVIKAAPLPYDGSSAKEKAKAFSEHGLESVAFKEYSEAFPHKKYTVGFAADGSPSFYINTDDNSGIHVGDPCFGKVVSGFDAIKRLENSPTRNGIWFERRIGIKSAKILEQIKIPGKLRTTQR